VLCVPSFGYKKVNCKSGLIFGTGFGTETEVLVFSKNWN
jgi:hypothetical protein